MISTVEYKDTNNNHYRKKISLENRIYSSREAKMFGGEKGSSLTGIVIVIVIVGGGIFGYRKWKKRKQKKKKK